MPHWKTPLQDTIYATVAGIYPMAVSEVTVHYEAICQ